MLDTVENALHHHLPHWQSDFGDHSSPPPRHPFLVITRLPGSGGSAIARIVGERLAWPVLDSELMERIERRFGVRHAILDMLDEARPSFLYEALGHLLSHDLISQNAYLCYLRKVVRAAAAEGPAVFVGRGTHFFLPRKQGLVVRVVADVHDRVERIVQRHGVSKSVARRTLAETHARRASFVRTYFHRDIDDMTLYDLVVNSSQLGIEGCADVVLAAHRARFPHGRLKATAPVAARAPAPHAA
ncbi:MAG TPA: cytidylate kinase-like family protein [Pirellulales bacterium]|nr:cytidylate kinase-like family protein [Pirellulales bacterium]